MCVTCAYQALDVDGARSKIDHDYRPDQPITQSAVRMGLVQRWIIDHHSSTDLVVLIGVAIAPDLLRYPPTGTLTDRPNGLQPAKRIALLGELVGVQSHEAEELPPCRLLLAAMPG